MKFYIETLGCFKNRVDSGLIASILDKNYVYSDNPVEADIILINTCTFIEKAKQESIETILHYCKMEEKKIIVVGCLGQRYGKELMKEIPEIDAVVGTYGFKSIEDVVKRVINAEKIIEVGKLPQSVSVEYSNRKLFKPLHYAFLKISDGCNHGCSFCIIPEVKGKLKSRRMESILKEARKIAKMGAKEIILISQDTTSYGLDIYGHKQLLKLLSNLLRINGLRWIRLLYNYPGELEEELLDMIVAEPKICRYLDIPVQHISDKILKAMRREVSGTEVRKRIMKIREKYPEFFLRTSVIVGFPGERDKDFTELYEFIKVARFERLGVFEYSREYGTTSYRMKNQIPKVVKEERKRLLMELQREISLENNKRFIGREIPVIIDEEVGGKYLFDGRTEFDAPEIDNGVLITKGDASVGEIVTVRITDVTDYDLFGEI